MDRRSFVAGVLAPAFLLGLAAATAPAGAAEKIRVVAAIPDLAAIAAAVGGDAVESDSIVRGNRDVHAVELLPSLMLKVRRADVYLKVGMDLDLWSQQLVEGSRNAKVDVVDVSKAIAPLEVPGGPVDASQGDLHRYGNPHYWLDPANHGPMARLVADALGRRLPARAAEFKAGAERYAARMDQALKAWEARLLPHKGAQLVSYHNSWPYFARRFGFTVVDFMEPKPGIPPTGPHIAALQQRLAKGTVKAILMESYFDDRVPRMLSEKTRVPLVKVPVLSGAQPGADDPLALFELIVTALEHAFAKGHA